MFAKGTAGNEIVITGISGKLPNSENLLKFKDNLMNGRDMVSDVTRWDLKHPEIPTRMGTMPNFEKYDVGHFGLHYLQPDRTSPLARNMHEKICEALFDAGINLQEIAGTRTNIYFSSCFSGSSTWVYDSSTDYRRLLGTGVLKSPAMDKIAHFLRINGVVTNVDTACSSSTYAIVEAYTALKSEKCDYAIVTSCSGIANPFETLQFAKLGVLSPDGSCKSFDESANGYVRSEAACAFILQRAKDARRIYVQIVHAKTNCDGYKEEGITFPSTHAQRKLLEGLYEECNVDPSTVSYVEAHATGTKAGDPSEVNAIDKVFTKNRKDPLLIGSVKSSIGHTEASAGMCSILKVILGLQEGCIPANIFYNKPHPEITALIEGRAVVVLKNTPWPKDENILVGVNSYGFGGANAHVLLKSYDNVKQRNLWSFSKFYLVYASSRVENGVTSIMDDVISKEFSVDYMSLINAAFRYNIPQHRYRGYAILTKDGAVFRETTFLRKDCGLLCLLFRDFGSEWLNIARELCSLKKFKTCVQNIHNILISKGLDLFGTIYNKTEYAHSIVSKYFGNFVIHVAMTELLMQLEVVPHFLHGSSIGIISAAYLSGSITLEEALHSVYLYTAFAHQVTGKTEHITQVNRDIKHTTHGQRGTDMADLDMTLCQSGLELINYLKSIQFESRDINIKLLSIEKAKLSSNTDFVEYIINGLIESVLDTSYLNILPENTTVCYIGQCRNAPDDGALNFVKFDGLNSLDEPQAFLTVLGRLYIHGYNFDISKLHDENVFPVRKDTPMISHLIEWNHEKNWRTSIFQTGETSHGQHHFRIYLEKDEYVYLKGHNIDNRILFPATGYIFLAWRAISESKDIKSEPNIVIRNLKFIRATSLMEGRSVDIEVIVRKSDGYFEILDNDAVLATGWISTDNSTLSLPTYSHKELLHENSDADPPMNEADVYKELRLRGYNYSGLFRSIKQYNFSSNSGLIHWQDNWVVFMDNMLQACILHGDRRNLYLPTDIEKITINSNMHMKYIEELQGNDNLVPFKFCSETMTGRCGGIEIKNPGAKPILKQKPLAQPVLEKHVFVPNVANLTVEESVRVNIQIILENKTNILRFKSIELTKGDETPEQLLSPLISDALADQPLITGEVIVLCGNLIEVRGAVVENGKLSEHEDCILVVGSDILSSSQILQQCLKSGKGGYIISREPLTAEYDNFSNLEILTVHTLQNEKLYLLRQVENVKQIVAIKIDNCDFSWLPMLKQAIKGHDKVVIYTENESLSGIMGLNNCARREPNCGEIRCVFVADRAPPFNAVTEFYKNQLSKDLAVNVYKNGKWGTYRHLPLSECMVVSRQHCFANVTTRGDLSSFAWIEGPLSSDSMNSEEAVLVYVYYSALNFRDVMLTTGRLQIDIVEKRRTKQELVHGFEFSGRTRDGRRVMGMSIGALSTMLQADRYLITDVPEEWSLEDAATVMVVYSTVLYAFKVRAKINSGQSILIHAGSGGVGQAAIRVALYHGLIVYTTVGTQEKRDFIKQQFPQLKDCQIGNSRDTSFEKLVLYQTNGRGVDYVLNSLAEDKLQASIRCIAEGGHFLEIGKYDLSNNSPLTLKFFSKDAAFHGVMLDCLFGSQPSEKKHIMDLLNDGISKGYVKPLVRKVFKMDQVEDAFRYMASGKHIGKVLVCIKKDDNKLATPPVPLTDGIPRYFCKEDLSYIITGGLGGFGLELTDWLILRGARNVVLNSRRGIRNGYQASRIRTWKSYGAKVIISTDDITTKAGCVKLIQTANALASVAGLFHLSVVLEDAILENQTEEKFHTSFKPKAVAFKHLDQVTREMCPNLRDFVAFSSVSCGRGNAGQTNYGMSNSVMERICEDRKSVGLPALAIQWGVIGEVGLVADMQEKNVELSIGGTLQQKLPSCFSALDKFLVQSEPIVSSMIVAEKRNNHTTGGNMAECVANILGINSMKGISMHASLAELGMDSMMAVEIQQSLEREYCVTLSLQDIRSLTFEKLLMLQNTNHPEYTAQSDFKATPFNIMWSEDIFYRHIIKLQSAAKDTTNCSKVFIIPGMGNSINVFAKIASQLNGEVVYLQHCGTKFGETIPEIGHSMYKVIKTMLSENEKFVLVTHSLGTMISLEVIAWLEKNGHFGEVVVIDGGTQFTQKLIEQNFYLKDTRTYNAAGMAGLIKNSLLPDENSAELKNKIANCRGASDAVQVIQSLCPADLSKKVFLKDVIEDFYKKILAFMDYTEPPIGLQSNFVLYRPKQVAVRDVKNDYELSACSSKHVPVTYLDGDHQTILEHQDIVIKINELLNKL